MSNWTHVSAIVRLNNMMIAMINPEKLKSHNFMRSMYAQDPIDPVQQCIDGVLESFNRDVPKGSEGPLKIALHIWPTREELTWESTTHLYPGGIYWGDVVISGDLRDFDDPDLIMQWLTMSCEALPTGVGVRDGTAYIYSEGGESLMVAHNGEDWGDPR